MESTFFVIRKSIDSLTETEYDEFKFKVDQYPFCIKHTLIRSWDDYGKKYTYEYILINQGKEEPIVINGTTFDNKIELYVDRNSALLKGPVYSLRINGKTKDGLVFNKGFGWSGKYFAIGPMIIYTLILISKYGPDKIQELYKQIFGAYRVEKLSLGETLTLLEEIKSMFDRINNEYPFMKLFYQECVKDAITIAKEKLSKYEILS